MLFPLMHEQFKIIFIDVCMCWNGSTRNLIFSIGLQFLKKLRDFFGILLIKASLMGDKLIHINDNLGTPTSCVILVYTVYKF